MRILLLCLILPLAAVTRGADASVDPQLMRWIGKPWPPAGAVTPDTSLGKGRWVVLIYDPSCGHCQSMAADYADLAHTWKAHDRLIRVALIDADPDSSIRKDWPENDVLAAILNSGTELPVPVVLILDAGKIVAAREGWEPIDWGSPSFARWIR
ncbi:MAG TPA: protein disulfide isomerase family protein [Chthoniobacteraceae bacterium]|nr:protein disulfide isomerase family protein [Chthoniobacteraceae bacterium]